MNDDKSIAEPGNTQEGEIVSVDVESSDSQASESTILESLERAA
jgi:hypothetical protein